VPDPRPDHVAALEARITALDAQIAAVESQLAPLLDERERCRAALAALEGALTDTNNIHTMEPMRQMQPLERIRHSKPPHGKNDARVARFLACCHAKGETMSDAAKALSTRKDRVYQAQLSSALRGNRPMWMPLAKRIEERYGYAATVENWPDLREV
jgi:hypothetical protein